MPPVDQALGEAHVDIVARLDKLNKDFAEAKTKTEATAKKMSLGFGRITSAIRASRVALGSFVAGLAAVGGARGIGLAVSRNLDFVDSLDKVSSKLGISTEFLQQAQYAASQSGVEFGQLSTALQYIARNAGEANKGIGEAKDTFKELGLSLADSNGVLKDTETLFRESLKAMSGMKSESEKVYVAMRLFGRSGTDIINMADSFETLSEKALRMGMIVDEQVIKKGVDAKDALDTLAKVTRANLAEALVEIAPVLVRTSSFLAAIAEKAALAWRGMSDFMNLRPTTLEALKDRVSEINEELGQLEGKSAASESTIKSLWETLRDTYKKWTDLGEEGGLLPSEYGAEVAHVKELKKELAELQGLISNIEEARNRPTGADGGGLINISKEQEDSLKRQLEGVKAIRAQWLEATDQRMQAIVEDRDASIAALDEKLIGEERYAEAKTQLYEIASRKIAELDKKGTDGIEKDWERLGDSASSSFARMLAEGRISFRALGQSFVSEFTERVLKSLVFSRLFKALEGMWGASATAAEYGPFSSGYRLDPAQDPLGGFRLDTSPMFGAPGAAGANIQIFNNTAAPVQTQELMGGDLRVFIGQQGSQDILMGGPLAQTLEAKYGLSAKGVRK